MLAELKRSFQAGSVVHAFLIHGDAGCGKKTLAMTLSMALHCQAQGERPCMQCGPCQRMLAGTHPDHINLVTEKASLSVKEIRDLIDALAEKPYEGGKRTVIVQDAEKMTEPAQNALLKTLEEPDGQTVFFLVTSHPEGLLPTIRSRCRPVYMPRLPEETVCADLVQRGFAPERAAYAARLCEGVLGRGIDLCDPKNAYFGYRDEAVRLLREVRQAQDLPKASMAWDEKRKPEDSLPFLDAMETVLRDAMRVHSGLIPLDAEITDDLEEIAGHFTMDAIIGMMEEVVSVRKRVHAHVQWRSAAEPLLFRIVEDAT